MPGSAGTEQPASILPAGGVQSRWGQALAKPPSLVVCWAQCAIRSWEAGREAQPGQRLKVAGQGRNEPRPAWRGQDSECLRVLGRVPGAVVRGGGAGSS